MNVKKRILSCSKPNYSSTSLFSSTSHASPGSTTMLSDWLQHKPPANQSTEEGNNVFGGKKTLFIGGNTFSSTHATNEREQTGLKK